MEMDTKQEKSPDVQDDPKARDLLQAAFEKTAR